MKKATATVVWACMLMLAVCPAVAWSGQGGGSELIRDQDLLMAEKDITPHEPKLFVIEDSEIPESVEKEKRGWFSRNKWYVLGALAIVAGGAAAAGGGGGSSSGGGGSGGEPEGSEVTVSW